MKTQMVFNIQHYNLLLFQSFNFSGFTLTGPAFFKMRICLYFYLFFDKMYMAISFIDYGYHSQFLLALLSF
jgi:hypothetical protein